MTIPGTGVTLESWQGDITELKDIEAIVNAANAQLKPGGGVAGAIHSKAGPGLEEECQDYAPLKPGEAVITGAHNLPNKYVIHCLGPVYGIDMPEARILASCYRGALNIAESNALKSIAFPAISTGIFGYPFKEAATVALNEIIGFKGYINLKLIRMVLWNQSDFQSFNETMEDIL